VPLTVRSDSYGIADHLTTELIDTPGVSIPSTESATIPADVLEKSTAYVLVLPYTHFEDSSSNTILQGICKYDQGELMYKVYIKQY